MTNPSTYRFPLPQNPSFTEFIVCQGLLPHELDRIESLWDDGEGQQAEVSGGDENYVEELRKSAVIPLHPEEKHRWIFDRIGQLATQVNMQHYAFDTLGIDEPLQLAEYGVEDFFQWHLDFGPGESSNRKLSLTVQLSDPDNYEGGALQFMVNDKIIDAPRERGTIVIFPSFVLHRVEPVTKGKRRSLVGWISGPPYR